MLFGVFFGTLCLPENFRRDAADQTAQILIIRAELSVLKTFFHGIGCCIFQVFFELDVFGSQRLERCIVFLYLRFELFCMGQKASKQRDELLVCLFHIEGRKPIQKLHNPVCLTGQVHSLFVYARGNVCSAGHAGVLSAFQIGESGDHVGKEVILSLNELCAVADDLLGTQALVLRQRNENDMHVRRLFVHVNDSGDDVLFADLFF